MKLTIRSILSFLLILGIAYSCFQLIEQSKDRQTMVAANAEIRNIRYGLLSVHSWKRQISEIMTKKVREFELTAENRKELKGSIQNAMYQLLDEVDRILADKRSEGNWLKRAFTSMFQSLVFNINELRSRVPQFTEIVLDELDKYESREKLRAFIQKKIDDLLYETVGEEDLSKVNLIAEQYGCTEIGDCASILQARLQAMDEQLAQKSWLILGLSILVFLLILLRNKTVNNLEYISLIMLCGILLYAGVSTPMIDIDARIDQFNFQLMGEPLAFNDQVLFFQSKSIFEVVRILTSTGDYQSILVGGLIFLFSIIFPIAKLIASLGLINKPSLYHNRVVNFLALKSGKWSMADVVVVAIFMAYIGFRGVIQNQLSQLESLSDKVEVLTTDNSNFGVGFMLFLGFCLGGLVLASFIEEQRKLSKTIEG